MNTQASSNFIELLKEFCEIKANIVLINPALGATKGTIIKINGDYLKFKVLVTDDDGNPIIVNDSYIFKNVYIPISSIYGLETDDTEIGDFTYIQKTTKKKTNKK